MLAELLRRASAATPAQCEVCRAWPARPVCEACLARFAAPMHRCARCALALPAGTATCGRCTLEPPPLDACFAAVSYGYPWAALVGRFKFGGEAGWAHTFADRMLDAPGVAQAVSRADALVPMPLSRERLAQRGFNQAHEIARRLSPAKVQAQLATRLRDTPAQAQLERADRLANLRGAFAAEPLQAARARGAHLLLVDDVMTSGASLFALAAALRQAGAARVEAAVFARTEEQ
ncbi:ComF family protein [Ramlibacter humi]|uniref:ComF family protein n=1 Tax=Ramlibacter humi TaxID=2530451 RepID=A0A4Z0BXL6_9BURK|nr:phosphoribosyltransferase family protein [Ramlibacter humi]TFZ03681.1 ComF family protein [Ramlibacter humi]